MASTGRILKSKGKSRGGCLQCKAKRIKCDEAKPSCMRCEQKGLLCPGYQLNVRWSGKHEVYTQPEKKRRGRSQDTAPGPSAATAPSAQPPPLSLDPNTNAGLTFQSPGQWDDSFWEPSQWEELMTGLELDLNSDIRGISMTHGSPGALQTLGSANTHSDVVDNTDTMPLDILLALTDIQSPWTTDTPQDEAIQSSTHDTSDEMIFHSPRTTSALETHSFTFPSSAQTPIFQTITDATSALVGHFFKEVVGLYCAWDGPLNSMRTISARYWQSNSPLCHTMQSMAALCLAASFPHLQQVAADERSKALDALRSQRGDVEGFEGRLIALMLLAQTSSWHAPNDLATEQFRIVQKALCGWQREPSVTNKQSLGFFTGCMSYWEMVLSFVTDSDELKPKCREVLTVSSYEATQACQPHEFSGVSSFMVKTLSEIGRVVFRARRRSKGLSSTHRQREGDFFGSLAQARALEKLLLSYHRKDPGSVVDPGDPTTSVSHFCQIDEAYRCTGLLQLYRVFPDLLRERYRPWSGHEGLLSSTKALQSPSEDEARTWLTSLALHTLSFLTSIPFESRTRCAQPWLLVAISNELRLTASSSDHHLDPFAIEIASARKFISARLHAYMQVFPLRKVRNVVDLVDLIWSEMDSGNIDTYWVDMAHERHLSTMMG